jgi:putative phosphoesterase
MPRRTRHEERAHALDATGSVTVAVVADTHSRPHPAVAAQLRELAPDLILHGGDVGALRVVSDLSRIAPTIAVRGNIDDHELPDSVLVRFQRDGDDIARLLLTHIAVRGPRLRKDVRVRAAALGAQLVVCGHSHVPLVASEGGVTVFNPGSIGPRRFALPITWGSIRISADDGIRLSHFDCETGARWLPPAA